MYFACVCLIYMYVCQMIHVYVKLLLHLCKFRRTCMMYSCKYKRGKAKVIKMDVLNRYCMDYELFVLVLYAFLHLAFPLCDSLHNMLVMHMYSSVFFLCYCIYYTLFTLFCFNKAFKSLGILFSVNGIKIWCLHVCNEFSFIVQIWMIIHTR